MLSGIPEIDLYLLPAYSSSLAFGSVTLFFRIKIYGFCVFLKNHTTNLRLFFFRDLGENTCSLQSALKNTAPGLNQDCSILMKNFGLFSFVEIALDAELQKYLKTVFFLTKSVAAAFSLILAKRFYLSFFS